MARSVARSDVDVVNREPKAPIGDPPPGCYDVFHHISGPGHAPKLYTTHIAPRIKGAFVYLIDDQNQEVWISGNVTIRPRKVR